MEETLNKKQHTNFTLEKKILPPLLPEFELGTFRSRVRRSNQQAIPVPLLQSQLCVLTLIRCLFHACITAVARKRPQSFCQLCKWQVTHKHANTLDPTKLEWADYAAVQA